MTAHFRTRNALAEIPTRMGNLRVSTPSNRNTLGQVIFDTSIDNISNFDSPATSPDEIVIRQRGRRRLNTNWSPEEKSHTTQSADGAQSTPTKNGSANLTLRSSPRKRLLDNFSHTTPEKIFSPKKTETPIKVSNNYGIHTSAKKLKFEERSIIQTSSNTPINVALKGLTKDQLINIIQGIVNEQPDMETKIRSNFPVPDLKPMEEKLIQMKKNIFRSLPSSRLISKTDSSAYSRAAVHLAEFKKTVVEQSRSLHDSKHWDALLDYSMTTWYHVRATPVWDNFAHNAARRHCFKILSWHCLEALRNGGNVLGEDRLLEFTSRVRDMSSDNDDIITCRKQLDFLMKKE